MKTRFLDRAPLESYRVRGRVVEVYRADLVPLPPLAPYLKMIELYPLLKSLAKVYKLIGYYAVPESEWVVSVPPIARSLGMQAVIGISQTKAMPSYVASIPESSLLRLTPNMYRVNFSRTKRHVEELGGLMLPMGLECQEVVDGMVKFLDQSPLPESDNYVVPVGSGVALSGIINHLNGRGRVFGVCTRPVKSVQAVIGKYVKANNVLLLYNEPQTNPLGQAPFPMHRYWDQNAFRWMLANLKSLLGSICFVNLGSGVKQ